MRVADWIVDRLSKIGVKHIFLLPGGGAMYLNDAVAKHPELEGIACHHEQACGIAAEAYGRTGAPNNPGFGVAMVTTGPGSTNIITPVAGAWIDSVPMLVLSGQAKKSDRICGRPVRQGGVQEVDIESIVKPITKYAMTVDDAADVAHCLDKALYHMRQDRSGPVWIDIPLDVQAAPYKQERLKAWCPPEGTSQIIPDFTEICALISQAERPVILAGHGVRLAHAEESFRSLVEKLDIPVLLTWNALDLLPFDNPMNIGRPGVVAARAPNFVVQNSDLLIAIGARIDNIVTAYNPKGFARAARKIVVDIDAGELADKTEMEIDFPILMDAKRFIERLLPHVVATRNPSWNRKCADWKRRYPQHEGHPFPKIGPIGHGQFVDALSTVIPENTLISVGSSGLAVEFFFAGFRNKRGQRTFLTSGLVAMGYGLPAAIGSCLGNNATPMVLVESDGSFQLNIQELATLKFYGLPICILIMNNNGYASIRNTQRHHFSGRYLASGPDSGIQLPSLSSVASTYDLPYLQINGCENLSENLTHALRLPRPNIIDVRLISDEVLEPKCATVTSENGSILSMPLEDMSPMLTLRQLKSEMIIDLAEESYRARAKS